MILLTRVARLSLTLAAAGLLMACADGRQLGELRPELGDFRLSHNIVLAGNAVQGPLSRQADPADWENAIRAEVARRFGRYEGNRLYHLAVNVDAYVLAIPGIPLVASPRSALIIGVHVWDDALGRPLNDERRQFTVLENLSGESLLGSGLTQSAEQQMAVLSRNAAIVIENWLAENPQWFPPADPAATPAPGSAAPAAAATPTPAATATGAAPVEPAALPAAQPALATPAFVPAETMPVPPPDAPPAATDDEPPVPADQLLPRRRIVPPQDTADRG
jgi:hypothetical protein